MWGGLGKCIYINSPNRGVATNLPNDSFLELRCDMDLNGVRPHPFGDMPVGLRAVDLVHQAGRKFGYIITSAFLPLLDDILATGIDVLIGLDPEEGKGTDFVEVKKRFHKAKRAIWGGVSGAITVGLGADPQTEQAVETARSSRPDTPHPTAELA